MSRGVARLGDYTIGVCKCHKTPIITGGRIITASSDVITNNRGTARLGDTVLANCGHTGLICTASDKTITNNRGTARLGDNTSGCYNATIITASSDRFTL
jgi:uncharacterized Zn-binding protein involved in type VI secretion